MFTAFEKMASAALADAIYEIGSMFGETVPPDAIGAIGTNDVSVHPVSDIAATGGNRTVFTEPEGFARRPLAPLLEEECDAGSCSPVACDQKPIWMCGPGLWAALAAADQLP